MCQLAPDHASGGRLQPPLNQRRGRGQRQRAHRTNTRPYELEVIHRQALDVDPIFWS